jgi:hypothetical protein
MADFMDRAVNPSRLLHVKYLLVSHGFMPAFMPPAIINMFDRKTAPQNFPLDLLSTKLA